MIRRIAALFFFLGVYILGIAENTRGKEYILVLNSINFNETWANNLYQNIRDEFSSPGMRVEAEELSIPMMTKIEEVEEKREYLLSRYSNPLKWPFLSGTRRGSCVSRYLMGHGKMYLLLFVIQGILCQEI